VTGFVAGVASLLRDRVGEDLTGLYVIGSLASGDAVLASSDVDLLVVVDDASGVDAMSLGGELADVAARCPLRGMEAVVYRAGVLRAPHHPLPHLVNVNAGPRMARSVSVGGDPAFWFLLDVAAARQHAITLVGPPAAALIGEPAPAHILAAAGESLAWQRRQREPGSNAVLNACRTWHWLATGTWLSKTAAGQWAEAQGAPDVVAQALAARADATAGDFSPVDVAAFLDEIEQRVRRRSAAPDPR
jgi:Domain of unknown function (DUF4111)